MTEQWMNPARRNFPLLQVGPSAEITPIIPHELRVARDGILTYCPCGWAYTFGYVPSGEDVSFVYRAHLDDLR